VLYVLNPPIAVSAVPQTGQTLAVRPLVTARPYKQQIVYREGLRLGQYLDIEWAEVPRDAVTRALVDAVLATGRFVDVGTAQDLSNPDYVLTGELRKFDLRRDTDPWTADCEVRLEMRKALGREVPYAATLTASAPLASNEISALPEAMSQAVGTIVSDAANRIAGKPASSP